MACTKFTVPVKEQQIGLDSSTKEKNKEIGELKPGNTVFSKKIKCNSKNLNLELAGNPIKQFTGSMFTLSLPF
jgi:hypothetical protein